MAFILTLLSVMFLMDVIVSTLNYKHSIQGVPLNVSHIYDEDEYASWLNYYRDNRQFNVLTKSFYFVLTFLLLILQLFGRLESLVGQISSNVYIQTLVFLGFYYIVITIINLPFDYYRTFVIEEKYGFNKSTKKTFFIDQIKQFLLIVVLMGALIYGLHALFNQFQQHIWVFIIGSWIAVSLIMIILFVLNTKVFIKIFNKLTPLEEGPLKTKIDALASSLGFQINRISVMDASKRSSKLNAFFSGLGKHRDIVLYDTLIEKMDDQYILAVLGHELSHALHKDTLKMLVAQMMTFLVYAGFIGLVLSWESLYVDFGLTGVHFGFAVLLFSIVIEPLSVMIGILTNYISRVAEYRADRFGAKHVSKEAMIGALEILAKENFSNLNPHPLFEKLYYNHPTISKRIASIKES